MIHEYCPECSTYLGLSAFTECPECGARFGHDDDSSADPFDDDDDDEHGASPTSAAGSDATQ